MGKIINFVKEFLEAGTCDRTPIGLCAFDEEPNVQVKKRKAVRKKELRLSELMNK